MNDSTVELLSPAGSWEAFIAAVENGANGIYIGGKMFSARKNASNFDLDEIKAACDYAHLRGVKIYVTVNTLIDNTELPSIVPFLAKLYNVGVDAVIVQDLGVAHLINQLLPQLPIHASTQMAVYNSWGAEFLQKLGIKRVVLARELSLKNISHIHRRVPQVELEVFAHGALCISYSGQCLMSSLIGGRSGNRGECAQPCRLTYKLVNEQGQEIAALETGEHLLSPKDLYTLDLLPEMISAGVKSLKIEGRMKKPEYVAVVTQKYRNGLDRALQSSEYHVLPEEEMELKQIFNRDFTSAFLKNNEGKNFISDKKPNNRGVFLGRVQDFYREKQQALIKLEMPLTVGDGIEIWVSQGGRVTTTVGRILLGKGNIPEGSVGQSVLIDLPKRVNPGDRVFKTHDEKLIAKAKTTLKDNSTKKIPIVIKATVKLNEPMTLTVEDNKGHKATVVSEFIGEKAEKRPIDEGTIQKQLNRLGNTPFTIAETHLQIEPGVMMPVSVINQLRREAVELLTAQIMGQYKREKIDIRQVELKFKDLIKDLDLTVMKRNKRKLNIPIIAVSVGNVTQVEAALEAGAKRIYIGGESFRSGKPLTTQELSTAIKICKENNCEAIWSMPRILHDDQLMSINNKLENILKKDVDGVLVGNMGHLHFIKKHFPHVPIYGDYFLNTFNIMALDFFQKSGIKQITLSPELTVKQISDLNKLNLSLELIVHGSLVMMTSEYCPVGSLIGGCDGKNSCEMPCKNKRYGLKDRINYIFPMEQDEFCRTYIYNPKKLCMLEQIPQLLELGCNSWRIDLKGATRKEIIKTIQAYQTIIQLNQSHTTDLQTDIIKETKDQLMEFSATGFTKGHYYRGVLGS